MATITACAVFFGISRVFPAVLPLVGVPALLAVLFVVLRWIDRGFARAQGAKAILLAAAFVPLSALFAVICCFCAGGLIYLLADLL